MQLSSDVTQVEKKRLRCYEFGSCLNENNADIARIGLQLGRKAKVGGYLPFL